MSERMLAAARRDEDQARDFAPAAELRASSSARPRSARISRCSSRRRAARREALDHVLFAGPPGLGKTTLAQIVARELGVNFRATSGPVIAKAGDLAALLTNLEDRDVLFIDEIHRLNPAVEEILYPAMEDFQLDLIIGEGPAARSVRIDLSRFTLIGATTRTGLLTTPLRERFGIPIRLEFYGVAGARGDRAARRAAAQPAADDQRARMRSRGARAARRASRGGCSGACAISPPSRASARSMPRSPTARCRSSRSTRAGSTRSTIAICGCIAVNYGGGPVGIETIAAALSEPRDAIEEIIEPYLLQQGFIARTPRGRVLTPSAFAHLGLQAPDRSRRPSSALFNGGDE